MTLAETSVGTPAGITASKTTASPENRGQAAENTKTAAVAAKAQAEETQQAAEQSQTKTAEVETKITAVIDQANGRRSRRDTATTSGDVTYSYTVPASCDPFLTMVDAMTTAIKLKTKQGYKKAFAIGDALSQVVVSNINCDAGKIIALEAKKATVTAVKEAMKTEIIKLKIKIKESIDTINKAIKEIKEVNAILTSAGKTVFSDPGTTLATVTAPTLPTEATTQGMLSFYKGFK